MADDEELPEEKVLEFEATIRRLADEGRLPSFEQFKQVIEETRKKFYEKEHGPGSGEGSLP